MQIKWWHVISFIMLLVPTATLWYLFIKALLNNKYQVLIHINWYYEAWPEFIGLTLLLLYGTASIISIVKGKEEDEDGEYEDDTRLRELLED